MLKTKLLTATAMTLIMMGLVPAAWADTTISTETTTPLLTAAAGNITVGSAGSIKLTSGTAITVNSDNTVTLNGAISMASSADGSTGILIDGGRTSTLSVTGDITVTDNYSQSDTNSDGVLDGVFAQGTGRYGIRSTGTTPFIGNVSVTSTSEIQVEGNQSYGIRFENAITGNFSFDGGLAITGEDSVGISLENGVSGDTYLSGVIAAKGKNVTAVSLGGDFNTVTIDGSYSGTGYSTTTSLSDTAVAALLAENKYQNNVVVDIHGNVAGGILLGSVPSDTSTSVTDEDGDGRADSTQQTASITSNGSAAALRVASATQDLTIGALTYGSTAVSPPSVRYGLLIRGNVSAAGILPEVDTHAIQISGLGRDVSIANGIGVYGTVLSSARKGSATAFSLLDGASTPRFDLSGTLSANNSTIDGDTALALEIASGASLPIVSVSSNGRIVASSSGSTGKAIAIQDRSDTLTLIDNKNIISSTISATDDNDDDTADTVINRAIAIDARTNTVGLTIIQTDTAPTDDTISAPYILGDILLGSGNDQINVNGGGIFGNVDLGAGANGLSLDGGATFTGKITSAGTVAIDIEDGEATFNSGSFVNATSLHVGEDGTLKLALDAAAPTTPSIVASGNVVFDDGAELGLALSSILLSPTDFTVITGAHVDVGTIAAQLEGNTPWLYNVVVGTNTAETALTASFSLKNQSVAGLTDNQYAALTPVLVAANLESAGAAGLTAPTTEAAFDAVYNQFLPDYSGENLISLSQGANAINRAMGDLSFIPSTGGQYWLSEQGFTVKRDSGETAGFESTGFAFSGGREQGFGGNSAVGVYVAYATTTPFDNFAVAAEQMVSSDLTIGGYWRLKADKLRAWAHAGAGATSFESTRSVVDTYVNHVSEVNWSGHSITAGGGVAYQTKLGAFLVTPKAVATYYSLAEEAHEETGGGNSFDLIVAERDSNLLSSTAMVNVAIDKWSIKPELWVGWKQNISAEVAPTVAHFRNGNAFTLSGGDITGGGPLVGFRIRSDTDYALFAVEGEYEEREGFSSYSVSLKTRFQF